MILSKRGQLTFFIIVGIVLLMGALFFLSSKTENVSSIISKKEAIEKTPVDARPVMETALDCLETVSVDNAHSIGTHGGFVDPYDLASDGSRVALESNSFKPTSGEAVDILSGVLVPYWHHNLGEGNCRARCVRASKRPALSGDPLSIEAQLERAISRDFQACMEDAKPALLESGYELTLKPAVTDVILTEEDFLVKTNAPIHILRSGNAYEIEDYQTRIDVPLKKLYNYAVDVTVFQQSYGFFELGTISLIASHTGLQEGQLPPLGETTSGRGKKRYWVKTEVKGQLKEILASYIPLFQVHPSLNFHAYDFGNAIGNSIAERFVLPLGSTLENPDVRKFKDYWGSIGVRFTYLPSWEIFFDVRGNGVNGELISPRSWTTDFPMMEFFETNDYEYYYDVSYPVLVTLEDPDALNGRGYKFQFALEVNLQNNQDPQYYSDSPEGIASFSADAGGALTCNVNQRNSPPMTIHTVDARTKKPIDNVRVNYRCGMSCTMGESEDGQLVTPFPRCIGGMVMGSVENYASYPIPLTTIGSNSRELELQMVPIKELEFTISKFPNRLTETLLHDPITRHKYTLGTSAAKMEPTEEVVISITPKQENRIYGIPPIFLKYTLQDEQQGTLQPLRIAPGEYEVSILTLQKKPTKTLGRWSCKDYDREVDCEDDGKAIPPKVEGTDSIVTGVLTGGFSFLEDSLVPEPCEKISECVYLNPQDFGENFFKGEVLLNWTVTDAIYTATGVEFFTVTSPDGFEYLDENGTTNLLVGDMDQIGKSGELAHSIRARLMPKYVRN